MIKANRIPKDQVDASCIMRIRYRKILFLEKVLTSDANILR